MHETNCYYSVIEGGGTFVFPPPIIILIIHYGLSVITRGAVEGSGPCNDMGAACLIAQPGSRLPRRILMLSERRGGHHTPGITFIKSSREINFWNFFGVHVTILGGFLWGHQIETRSGSRGLAQDFIDASSIRVASFRDSQTFHSFLHPVA